MWNNSLNPEIQEEDDEDSVDSLNRHILFERSADNDDSAPDVVIHNGERVEESSSEDTESHWSEL